jgi:hypothetical protein
MILVVQFPAQGTPRNTTVCVVPLEGIELAPLDHLTTPMAEATADH